MKYFRIVYLWTEYERVIESTLILRRLQKYTKSDYKQVKEQFLWYSIVSVEEWGVKSLWKVASKVVDL